MQLHSLTCTSTVAVDVRGGSPWSAAKTFKCLSVETSLSRRTLQVMMPEKEDKIKFPEGLNYKIWQQGFTQLNHHARMLKRFYHLHNVLT